MRPTNWRWCFDAPAVFLTLQNLENPRHINGAYGVMLPIRYLQGIASSQTLTKDAPLLDSQHWRGVNLGALFLHGNHYIWGGEGGRLQSIMYASPEHVDLQYLIVLCRNLYTTQTPLPYMWTNHRVWCAQRPSAGTCCWKTESQWGLQWDLLRPQSVCSMKHTVFVVLDIIGLVQSKCDMVDRCVFLLPYSAGWHYLL